MGTALSRYLHRQVDSIINPYNYLTLTFLDIFFRKGFYLITKKRLNGFATVKPIVLEVFIEMWPLLLIVLLVYGYMSIMFWSLDRLLELNQFPRSFIQGFCFGLWWLSYHLFTPNRLVKLNIVQNFTINRKIMLKSIDNCKENKKSFTFQG